MKPTTGRETNKVERPKIKGIMMITTPKFDSCNQRGIQYYRE